MQTAASNREEVVPETDNTAARSRGLTMGRKRWVGMLTAALEEEQRGWVGAFPEIPERG